MVELFANSGNPDQTPRSAASDLGLHCLPVTILGITWLQWVKVPCKDSADKKSHFNCVEKKGLSCHVNRLLGRRVTWNAKPSFIWKINIKKKIFQNVVFCRCDWCFKGYAVYCFKLAYFNIAHFRIIYREFSDKSLCGELKGIWNRRTVEDRWCTFEIKLRCLLD